MSGRREFLSGATLALLPACKRGILLPRRGLALLRQRQGKTSLIDLHDLSHTAIPLAEDLTLASMCWNRMVLFRRGTSEKIFIADLTGDIEFEHQLDPGASLAAVDAKGTTVAFVRQVSGQRLEVCMRQPGARKTRVLMTVPGTNPRNLQISQDGRFVMVQVGAAVYRFGDDPDGGMARQPDADLMEMTPNGYYAYSKGTALFQVGRSEPYDQGRAIIGLHGWTPDGAQILFSEHDPSWLPYNFRRWNLLNVENGALIELQYRDPGNHFLVSMD